MGHVNTPQQKKILFNKFQALFGKIREGKDYWDRWMNDKRLDVVSSIFDKLASRWNSEYPPTLHVVQKLYMERFLGVEPENPEKVWDCRKCGNTGVVYSIWIELKDRKGIGECLIEFDPKKHTKNAKLKTIPCQCQYGFRRLFELFPQSDMGLAERQEINRRIKAYQRKTYRTVEAAHLAMEKRCLSI